MDIRKVSIGADYKSGAMHYIVGQEVLGKNYIIHLIQYDSESKGFKIWIQHKEKSFYGRSSTSICQYQSNII